MINAIYTIYAVIAQIGGFCAFVLIMFAIVKIGLKPNIEEEGE